MKIPPHLHSDHAKGVVSGEVVAQFEIGDFKNFIYLILDWNSKRAAIVDPQKDLTAPLKAIEEHGFRLESILLTHTHFDHIAGVVPLLSQFPDLNVYAGNADLHRLPGAVSRHSKLKILQDSEMLSMGDLKIHCFHTPGHSAGEFCYFLSPSADRLTPYLFTGDTIFIRDCGRTDLETGSNEAMFASIQKIKTFPPETVFLVGHHYAKECSTTLEQELETSPPFQCKTVQELNDLP